VDYAHRNLPVHPYVLGAWLGDGDSQGPTLTFHRDDREVFDRCVALHGFGTVPKPDKRNPNVLRGMIGARTDKTRNHAPDRLRLALRRLGVLGRKGCKHIPSEYLTASIMQRYELLAGLLDTDGTVGRKGSVQFDNTNERLAVGVLELVRSLGCKATLRSKQAKLYGRVVGTAYTVSFNSRVPVFKLARKAALQKLSVFGRAGYRSVVAIDRGESVPVRCISVDSPDHSYLAGRGYLVTHNTQQIAVLRTLWLMGRNPNLRQAIISRSQEGAEKILRAIKGYIEQSDALHEVFPDLRPGSVWSDSRITVAGRRAASKDYSIIAAGIGTQGIMGSRLDRVVMDDVLDWGNSRTPSQRDMTIGWYESTITGRLVQHASVEMIGNAWHPEDLMHKLAENPVWRAFRFPVTNPDGAPRWPARWPLTRIAAWTLENGSNEAARQLHCLARDDASARFKRAWFIECLRLGDGRSMPERLAAVPFGYKTYTGVDLGTDENAKSDLSCLFTICIWPSGHREVLCVESGHWAGPEIIRRIVDTHRRYRSIIAVESNAAQKFITQFTKVEAPDVPVRNFFTGANKADPAFGIESLAVEFERGQWVIPSAAGRPLTKEVDAWIRGCLHYQPNTHTPDELMASWIAREAASHRVGRVQTGRQTTLRR
jgi:hypothetical protein